MAERRTILALPTEEATLIRHRSLDEQDLALLDTRRRDDTQLGLALQLCAILAISSAPVTRSHRRPRCS